VEEINFSGDEGLIESVLLLHGCTHFVVIQKKVRETETRSIPIHSCFENDSDGHDKSGIAHLGCAFPTVRPSCVLVSNLCELRQTAQL